MDNFIEEVEEELKRERYQALWNKYGRYALAGVLLIVIAVAGVVGWRQYRHNQQVAAGLAYQDALELVASGKTEDALAAFGKVGDTATGGYATLARLQAAALQARQGNSSAAAAAYDKIAKDDSAPEVFRHLSLLLYALTVADKADPVALAKRLKPLTAADSPWRFSALELTALLSEREGNRKAARDIYRRLADDQEAPQHLRARAAEFLAITGK